MPKIVVCKGCGQQMMAVDKNDKPACLTCFGISKDNSIPIEMDIPNEVRCSYGCGSTADWDDKEKVWVLNISKRGGWNVSGSGKTPLNGLPFMDAKKGRFYCGCRGWD